MSVEKKQNMKPLQLHRRREAGRAGVRKGMCKDKKWKDKSTSRAHDERAEAREDRGVREREGGGREAAGEDSAFISEID